MTRESASSCLIHFINTMSRMPRIASIRIVACLLTVAGSLGISQQQQNSLASFLPTIDSLTGWYAADTARIYRGEDLFLLIDGGADLFFEYGFRQVLHTEYENRQRKTITLEIHEMSDPGAAFGIFSVRSGTHAVAANLGQEGIAGGDYTMFWKERFFVSLAGSDSSAECLQTIDILAKAVDRKISEHGARPLLVEILPASSLLKRKYVRGILGLSTVAVFDDKDIFRMTDGAVGLYRDHTLIFLKYGSADEAGNRFSEIGQQLKSGGRFTEYKIKNNIISCKDGKSQTICFGQSGANIVISISADQDIALGACERGAVLLRAR